VNEDRPPDEELAAELRQTAGREWAEEAAEDERLTELLRRRNLGMADVLMDLAHRGGRVSVEFGGHTFGGAVEAAGEDYASVQGPGQAADLRLASTRWSVLPTGDAEERWTDAPETFRGILQHHASGERVIRLALPGGDMVIGKIAVVASDHVEVEDPDGRDSFVPFEMILGVIRSTDFQ
jgi:hypothetical protein